jgi:hypothetical protein
MRRMELLWLAGIGMGAGLTALLEWLLVVSLRHA